MKVKDLLNVMSVNDHVEVVLYAYGFRYAESYADGIHTVKEAKEQLNYDALNAKIFNVYSYKNPSIEYEHLYASTVILAEMCK